MFPPLGWLPARTSSFAEPIPSCLNEPRRSLAPIPSRRSAGRPALPAAASRHAAASRQGRPCCASRSQSAASRGTAVAPGTRRAHRREPDGLAQIARPAMNPDAPLSSAMRTRSANSSNATPADSSVHGTEPSASAHAATALGAARPLELEQVGALAPPSASPTGSRARRGGRCQRGFVGEPGHERLDHAGDAGLAGSPRRPRRSPRAPRLRGRARRDCAGAPAATARGTSARHRRCQRRTPRGAPDRSPCAAPRSTAPSRAARPRRAGRRPRAARPHCAPARRRSPRRAARQSRAGRARARCRP